MVLICKGHPRVEQPTERDPMESFRCVVCGNELIETPIARFPANQRERILAERPKESLSSYPEDKEP